ERFMGDAARDRARPWLVATSLVLLAISVLAGSALIWFLNGLGLRLLDPFSPATLRTMKILDLGVSALVGLAIVLVGQAAVSYEVFTGHVLPRRGLYGQWRQALVLAAAFGALVGFSLTFSLDPVYGLLVATMLLTLALVVHGRRSYSERERATDTLRALVESDRSYERLMQEDGDGADDRLAILCRDVLGTEVG